MAVPNLVNFPKLWDMTISKATFAPSTPCTIHFEGLESGPNDSTRVPSYGFTRDVLPETVDLSNIQYTYRFQRSFTDF